MKKLTIIGAIIAIILAAYLFLKKGDESPYTFEVVGKHNISQTVSVTGSVEANPTIDLQFQKSGKINSIYVIEGQEVKKDTIIADLENDDLAINIRSASSDIAYYNAKLQQEIVGPTPEKIKLSEISVEKAEIDLENSKKSLVDLQLLNLEKIEAAQLTLDQATIGLEQAESDLEYAQSLSAEQLENAEVDYSQAQEVEQSSEESIKNTQNTYKQNLDNAYEDVVPKMDMAILTIDQNLESIDDILGVDGSSLLPDTINLAAKDSETERRAQEAYGKAKKSRKDAKETYSEWNLEEKKEELGEMVEQISESLNLSKEALDTTYTALETSVDSGTTGVSNDLKTFKDLMISEKSSNYTAYQNLRDYYQAVLSAEIAYETNTHTAEQTEIGKENLSEDAAQNIDTVKLTTGNDIKDAELQVEVKETELKKAQQALNETKINSQKQENDLDSQIKLKAIAISNAKANHEDVIAPPREVDLKSIRANLAKASASYEKAVFEYNKTVLKAPADGIVVDIKKDLGENITSSEVFTVINAPSLIIRSNVSETDIAKIAVGNKVTMTFDAFDFNEEFEGEVIEVAPAETIIDGVIYYQIKTSFSLKEDKQVRSGMTANLNIFTAQKEDALAIPIRAIKYEDNKRLVEVLIDEEVQQLEVETGIEGDQYLEILSGLELGQQIITFTKYEYSL